VEKLLKLFTFLSLEEIEEIMESQRKSPELRKAQKRLALEVTTIVHGEESARTAERVSCILFGDSFEPRDLSLDILEMLAAETPGGTAPRSFPASLADLLVSTGACPSKSEVRRLIRGGGLYVNGVKIPDEDASVSEDALLGGKFLFVRLGKKRVFMIQFE